MSRQAGVALAALLLVADVSAQEMGRLDGAASGSRRPELVRYVAEPQTAVAGRRSVLEVRLQIADGFHVNSHAPKSDLLIPTVLLVTAEKGVAVGAVQYPAGSSTTLAADPSEVLDVYTGMVALRVPVTATAGEHALEGTLRYQACDGASCFPPKTMPVKVLFTAR